MKIATWNLERPTKNFAKFPGILKWLKDVDADIVILTETNEFVNLGDEYISYHTTPLSDPLYKEGERRVSIHSKYGFIEQLDTYDGETSICIKLKTPLGDLAVYGTIIGIQGNRMANFKTDLELQLADFKRLAATNNLCISGDLNISFADNYYHTEEGRDKLKQMIEELKLVNMTGFIPQNIDHIILPLGIIGLKKDMQTWNTDKKLSDHMGVAITLV